ncbi:hypothetical protein [uncultured Christiangramia sp.]|uniref:hypothetical protein n=1 Tax=uncultured Christiangramia sp. TaxID=503836 RepID=UPI00262150C3|nr:hypothetical protein [uncultured Christiangramia sp.]
MALQELKNNELKGQTIGLHPTQDLVHLLQKYLNRNDWPLIANITGYKSSTARDLYYGSTPITEGNMVVLCKMAELAKQRCVDHQGEIKADMKKLQNILK